MARSGGNRGVMESHCLNRFRRRRLLAFLHRSNLPATFDAYAEARDARLFRFALPAAPGGGRPVAGGARVLQPFPAVPGRGRRAHRAQIRHSPQRRAYWDPVDWQLIRLKAAQLVKDLVMRSPEFRHLLRLPRCPSHPCYTIPFGFGGCRRHKRKKNIGRMSASLLARRFLQKERRHSSPCYDQGLSCEPVDLEEIIDETLLAGKQEVKEHSDSCSEGVPGCPVGLFISKSFGTAPPNTVTKRSSQECSAESSNGAKLKPTAGQFCPVDADHVLNKVQALGDISNDMATLVKKTCTHSGPDHKMFLKKLLEQEKLLFELRLDCLNAMIRGCTSP